MTSARRAAIKKAQRISAQKRRGKRRRKIALGVGAAAGVIGVTLYASRKRRGRSKGHGSMNAVSTTLEPQIKYSDSKEIDFIRLDRMDATRFDKKGREKIDFSLVGKPEPGYNARSKKIKTENNFKRQALEKKLNTHVKKKGVTRATVTVPVDRVLRNRVKFNDDRRSGYSPNARAAKYQREKEAISQRRKDRIAAQKLLEQQLSFPKTVIGSIKIKGGKLPKSSWPLLP